MAGYVAAEVVSVVALGRAFAASWACAWEIFESQWLAAGSASIPLLLSARLMRDFKDTSSSLLISRM